ncbi:MAG: lipopolysaccharide heptosyltransferase I [Burkholderiaceae bacterium]
MNPAQAPRNILIVRVSSLGDVVHNMPMVADLGDRFPEARIDWVVEEAYAPLVQLNHCVTQVLPYALRRWRKSFLATETWAEMAQFWRALRAVAYDLVLDTQGLLKTSVVMRMARLAPGGQRVGLANATVGSGYEPISRIFHTRSIPVALHTHAVQRARLVAACAVGYEISNSNGLAAGDPVSFCLDAPALSPTAASWLPDTPYAVFFHGSSRTAKRWAPDRWIAVGKMLSETGTPILLPWGSAAEKRVAHHLAEHIPGAVVLPHLPMMDAVLLAQRAALVVGVDTGLTHIAAAYMRPTVELYCDSPRWKTEGNWSVSIINLGDAGIPPSVVEVKRAIEALRKPA